MQSMESVVDRPRASALDLSELHRLTLRLSIRIGVVGTICMGLLAAVTRDRVALWMLAGSLVWALLAWILIKTGRESGLVMLGVGTLIVSVYPVISDTILVDSFSSLAVILTGVGAALFLRRGENLFVLLHSVYLLGVNLLWHGWTDRALADGVVSAMAFVGGSLAVRWVRDRSLDSTSRFLNLFQNAPVSIWEEDFSKVGVWLEGLRKDGVTDLHQHLADNPDVLRDGMSLIEVVRVNREAVDFMQVADPSELVGPLRPETFPDNALAPMSAQFEAVWNGLDQISVEVRRGRTVQGNHLDGLLHWAAPRRFGKPDLSRVIVALVDVTEMNDARRGLERSLQSKDELIATVSHELRTPLTTVVGLSTELSDAYDQFSKEEARELLRMIADQSIEVATIVEDLLVAARAESGSLKVSMEPVDLHLEAKSTLRGLEMETEVDCHTVGVVPAVPADPGRVRQILRNLVVNARKYGTDPIRIVVRHDDSNVKVEVRDHGSAIPDDEREAIFERYYRARQTPGVTASVGLGLTVSRELARVMGGDLTYGFDGESVFTLSLPASEAAPD